MSGLHESRRARADGPRPGLAQIVGALRHPEPLVDLEPEAIAPGREHLGGELLAGAHAVAQRGDVGAPERGLLEDLPVDRRHADEDGRPLARDPRGPARRVGDALVHDRRVAAIERVHEPGPEDVGPVVLARVQHAIARRVEVEPVLRRRLASEQRAMRVHHALRVAGGSRGVDEVGRVLGTRGMRRLPAIDRRERRLECAHVDAGPRPPAVRRRPAAPRAAPFPARAPTPSCSTWIDR